MVKVLITFIIFFSSICIANETGDAKSFSFFKEKKTDIINPFELRDPFKRKTQKRSRLHRNLGVNPFYNGDEYTNKGTLDGIPIEKIRVVGVLLGPNRRAMVKVINEKENPEDYSTFIVKEGMKLGQYNAEVKAILPGGIVLVEKIRNVYDQDEYLETIIPVSE